MGEEISETGDLWNTKLQPNNRPNTYKRNSYTTSEPFFSNFPVTKSIYHHQHNTKHNSKDFQGTRCFNEPAKPTGLFHTGFKGSLEVIFNK